MDKTLHQGRWRNRKGKEILLAEHWYKAVSMCAAPLVKVVVWGWCWSTGSSSQAADIKPLKVLALRPGTKCSTSEGSIVAGRKEKI